MKRIAYLIAALATASFLTAAAPSPSVDHVAVYDRPPPTGGRPAEETLRQHGDRQRIDSRSVQQNTGLVLIQQTYLATGRATAFTLIRLQSGRLAYLSLVDDPDLAPPPLAARTLTGETQTWIGERCRVWRVSRRITPEFTFVQSGCGTPDGVELWRRLGSDLNKMVARQVTRRPVAAAEVRPPVEVLDLIRWAAPARGGAGPPSAHAGDYEVVLEGGAGRRRIARRSGAWTSMTEWRARSTTVQVANEAEGVRFSHRVDGDGRRSLLIDALPLPAQASGLSQPVRLAARPDERVLGETCQWWHLTPHIEDYSRAECRTRDGVALKVAEQSRGDSSTTVAVRLVRRPQPLSAVLPDRKLVNPAAWGL